MKSERKGQREGDGDRQGVKRSSNDPEGDSGARCSYNKNIYNNDSLADAFVSVAVSELRAAFNIYLGTLFLLFFGYFRAALCK